MPEQPTRTPARARSTQEEQIIDVLTSRTLSAQTLDELAFLREHPELSHYPPWGIDILDRLTRGIGPWYITFVAKQKFGKSFFVQHMRKQVNAYGKKNLTISLEMDEFMVACRLFANEAGVPLSKFNQPHEMTQEEWEAVVEAQRRIAEFNQLYNFDARRISQIQRIIEALDPEYIFIDYLGLMSAENTRQSRNEQIGEISRALKAMTRQSQSEEDERERSYQLMLASVQSMTDELGYDAVQDMVITAETMMAQYRLQVQQGLVQPRIRRRRGIVTPLQTSKGHQEEDKLGDTAPKDSQAPFEDCDLGMTGNMVKDPHSDKDIPHLRMVKVQVSRVCPMGDEFRIGINTSLGDIWDYETFGEKGPRHSIVGRF